MLREAWLPSPDPPRHGGAFAPGHRVFIARAGWTVSLHRCAEGVSASSRGGTAECLRCRRRASGRAGDRGRFVGIGRSGRQLVSRQSKSAGGLGGDDPSRAPALSANGRYVAFQTEAGTSAARSRGRSTSTSTTARKRVELVSRQSRSDGGGGADGGFLSAVDLGQRPLRRLPVRRRQPRRFDRRR